jgi:hypothetical protein
MALNRLSDTAQITRVGFVNSDEVISASCLQKMKKTGRSLLLHQPTPATAASIASSVGTQTSQHATLYRSTPRSTAARHALTAARHALTAARHALTAARHALPQHATLYRSTPRSTAARHPARVSVTTHWLRERPRHRFTRLCPARRQLHMQPARLIGADQHPSDKRGSRRASSNATVITVAPITRRKRLARSPNTSRLTRTPSGIFALFMTERVLAPTCTEPQFQRKNPTPDAMMPK